MMLEEMEGCLSHGAMGMTWNCLIVMVSVLLFKCGRAKPVCYSLAEINISGGVVCCVSTLKR